MKTDIIKMALILGLLLTAAIALCSLVAAGLSLFTLQGTPQVAVA